ncbi:MAG: DUF116 domain-containing protein [bacterium]
MMLSKAPTYLLGPDFPQKPDKYIDRFLKDGFDFFATEFCGIDDYLEKAKHSNSTETLRRTPKEKYLLELVAFGIYDRLNRRSFNRAKNTLIVMPDCLSLHNPKCEKVQTDYGDVCKRCTESCQAYQITELARTYRLKTVFSKRKLLEQLQHYAEKMEDLSVVGVACINMLAEGMRVAIEAGVPTRGVLLNFSGCEHWQDEECASEFAMKWLQSILDEKYGSRDTKTDYRRL